MRISGFQIKRIPRTGLVTQIFDQMCYNLKNMISIMDQKNDTLISGILAIIFLIISMIGIMVVPL